MHRKQNLEFIEAKIRIANTLITIINAKIRIISTMFRIVDTMNRLLDATFKFVEVIISIQNKNPYLHAPLKSKSFPVLYNYKKLLPFSDPRKLETSPFFEN